MFLQEAQTGPAHTPRRENIIINMFHHFFHPKELQPKDKLPQTNKTTRVGKNQFKVRAVAIPILFLCSLIAWFLRELVHGPELEETDSVERQSKGISPVMLSKVVHRRLRWASAAVHRTSPSCTAGIQRNWQQERIVALALPQPPPQLVFSTTISFQSPRLQAITAKNNSTF